MADAASRRTNPGAGREGHKAKRINPRYRKGATSTPTGRDEGSRSSAQYRNDAACVLTLPLLRTPPLSGRSSVRLPTRWLAFGRVGLDGFRYLTHWVT